MDRYRMKAIEQCGAMQRDMRKERGKSEIERPLSRERETERERARQRINRLTFQHPVRVAITIIIHEENRA